MRRTLPGALLLAVLPVLIGLVATPVAPAGAATGTQDGRTLPGTLVREARQASAGRGDLTAALTRLRLAYPRLGAADRAAADRLLARPTDGANDAGGDGWTVPEATPVCGPAICVHYVATTDDAPDQADADADGVPDQVEVTLDQLQQVLGFLTAQGYRPPPGDGTAGGDGRFDVYLSEIGDAGLYGYCAPESPIPHERFVYSSYCVLDDDFTEFPLGPLPSLVVTAAHEFFHAVQFGYDASEDPWLLESTATWMEEQYADDVNDNRQYLRAGQLRRPTVPLDTFESGGAAHYGNWLFFELMSQTYGRDVVRRVFQTVDSRGSARDDSSTEGVARVLKARGTSLPAFYARFAAVNQQPAAFYSEGSAYGRAPVAGQGVLSAKHPSFQRTRRLDHLTSATFRLRPAASLAERTRLRVQVQGPGGGSGTGFALLVRDHAGKVKVTPLRADARGIGTVSMRFSRAHVREVSVVAVNASDRFRCWRDTPYTCHGTPRDDGQVFRILASVES